MKTYNLFLKTRSLTISKKDHLTEFLAALITMNEPFNLEFSQLVLGEFAARHGWTEPVIDSVETQVSYSGTSSCPDMRFTLEDGHVILCENTIDVPEIQGVALDPVGQLERYLDLPSDGLVYISDSPCNRLAEIVTNHPRFITHKGYHFLWRDIYPLLVGNANPLVAAVCKGFELIGFVPPHPAVGTLSDFNSTAVEQNRLAFKELWQLAAAHGRQSGWQVEINENAEMYYSLNVSCPVCHIFVSPSAAERFLIRLTLREGVDSIGLRKLVESASTSVPFEVSSYQRMSLRGSHNVAESVIDIASSLKNIIGDVEDRDLIQQLLLEYVRRFVEAVSSEKYEADNYSSTTDSAENSSAETSATIVESIAALHADQDRGAIIYFDELKIDPVNHWVWRGLQKINLTKKEYDLLLYMVHNSNQILSREMINEHAFENTLDIRSNIIDVYVNYLRNKLDKSFSTKLIHTVRGQGYILNGSDKPINTDRNKNSITEKNDTSDCVENKKQIMIDQKHEPYSDEDFKI
jgi:DNA-binding winged helix-turn-helix (wHTH) protein